MIRKVWDEITDSFPNFKSYTVEACEWMGNFIAYSYDGCN